MATYFGWLGFVITAYFLVSGINGLRRRNPRAKKNFLWMLIGPIIWLFAFGNSLIMVLFTFGLLAFIFFLIAGILALFKRNGKAKKRFLLMLVALVICIGSAAMIPNDKKETSLQASEVKVKSQEAAKKKAAVLEKAKEEAELKEEVEAEQKAKQEAEEKAKQEAEAEQKAQAEAEKKAQEEAQAAAEAKARAEAEAKAEAQAQAQAKAQQQQQAASSTPADQTSFANCTELRKVYPNGVASTHAAYTSKMDRDNDNYACERN